jgi:hypothetical protein
MKSPLNRYRLQRNGKEIQCHGAGGNFSFMDDNPLVSYGE